MAKKKIEFAWFFLQQFFLWYFTIILFIYATLTVFLVLCFNINFFRSLIKLLLNEFLWHSTVFLTVCVVFSFVFEFKQCVYSDLNQVTKCSLIIDSRLSSNVPFFLIDYRTKLTSQRVLIGTVELFIDEKSIVPLTKLLNQRDAWGLLFY